MRRTLLAYGMILLGLAAGACDDSQAPASGGGSATKLRVLVTPGLSSLLAPVTQPWAGVFGDFPICADGSGEIELESVDFTYKVPPLDPPEVKVRVYPATENATATAIGSLDKFSEGRKKLPGDFFGVDGYKVAMPCAQQGATRTELMVGLDAGAEGVWVEGATINYVDSNGQTQEAELPWEMVLCGSATTASGDQDPC